MKKSFLLIEDNPGDIELTKVRLEELGFDYDLKIFERGLDAKEFLDKTNESFDLIFLDLILGDINGFEILQLIKAKEVLKQIPVVAFHSGVSLDHYEEEYNIKPDFYIEKPIDSSLIKTFLKN
jgi:CheY-like chemotaxis protein